MRFLLAAVAALAGAAHTSARQQQGPGAPAQPEQLRVEDLPPLARLGVRVELLRQAWPAAPVVVLAPDAFTALDAMGHWTPQSRFPVLIDDGSARAREDIARFVRAYEPDEVLAWPGPDMRVALAPSSYTAQVMARVWGAGADESMPDRWRALGVPPPGVVVASEGDGAWIAGAALSIGRGQPIAWVDPPGGALGRTLSAEETNALDAQIRRRLDEVGFEWRTLGDLIDAVTICLNGPTRIAGDDERGPRALTDRIGRHITGDRWAWAGVVPGEAPQALHRAMSSLFLHDPKRAWFFDGYQDKAPYNRYAVEPAAERFEQGGLEAIVDRAGDGSLAQWLRRAGGAIDAGYIHVNTSGNRRWFNLNPGRAYARDIPLLEIPAAVHFIHSFSAQNPGDAQSIAATWLDRGAFCYVGAVDEPFLTAFLPPEPLARRLLSAVPWGAATRIDDAPLWKVNVFGDPLYTMGKVGERAAPAPTLEGAVRVSSRLRDALNERDLEAAGRDLALLGRDDDLLRLARAALREEADDPARAAPGPTLADAALHAAARRGEGEIIPALLDRMDLNRREDPRVGEVVWLALGATLRGSPDRETLAGLQRTAGGASLARDAERLARAMARVLGAESAAAYLGSVAAGLEDARQRERLERTARDLLQ